MSNRSALIKAVNCWDEDACGAALDVLGVPRETSDNSGHDAPDANGLVAFTGLRAGHPCSDWRFHVKEIVETLPDGHAKDIGIANLGYVNGLNVIEGWPDAAPVAGVIGSGATVRIDPRAPNIPKALVFAPQQVRTGKALYDTVQAATDYLNSLPDSAFT